MNYFDFAVSNARTEFGAKVKIKTYQAYPSIPIRSYDWIAIDDNTYDGPGSPMGTGPTEQAAIEDLKEQLADRGRQ